MTPIATTFLVMSLLILWGGLVASVLYLARRPERADYPSGGVDDHREDSAPLEHDT